MQPRSWKKRIAEDLDKVFEASGCALRGRVTLELRGDNGRMVSAGGVPVTEENRDAVQACWEARDACPDP